MTKSNDKGMIFDFAICHLPFVVLNYGHFLSPVTRIHSSLKGRINSTSQTKKHQDFSWRF